MPPEPIPQVGEQEWEAPEGGEMEDIPPQQPGEFDNGGPEGELFPEEEDLGSGRSHSMLYDRKTEATVVAAINRVRESHGLNRLVPNDRLVLTGRSHSAEMLRMGYFDHQSPNPSHRTFVERMRRQGIKDAGAAGENIAMGSRAGGDPAKRFVRSWMESPGHKANILNAEYRYTGVGVAVKGDKVYATQLFSSDVNL